MDSDRTVLSDLRGPLEILRHSQGFPPLTVCQEQMFEFMVTNHNSVSQLATGQGKTYPAICVALVLDILRDIFGHKGIPIETRTLYILPLGKPSQLINTVLETVQNCWWILRIIYCILIQILYLVFQYYCIGVYSSSSTNLYTP